LKPVHRNAEIRASCFKQRPFNAIYRILDKLVEEPVKPKEKMEFN